MSSLCMATVGTTPEGYVFPIRCKRWDCPVCAQLNAYRHAIRVANACQALVTAGIRPKFVTITEPGEVATPGWAYRILHEQWDGLRNRLQYWSRSKSGIPIMYAAFVEGQPRRDFMPHFHIILSACPRPGRFKKMAVASGFGYQTKIEPFKTGSGVAWYVSKYATKADDCRLMPDGFRRVRYSENFPNMRFRTDEREGQAIIKQFRESYTDWLDRCKRAGVDADTLERNFLTLLEQAPDVEDSLSAEV